MSSFWHKKRASQSMYIVRILQHMLAVLAAGAMARKQLARLIDFAKTTELRLC